MKMAQEAGCTSKLNGRTFTLAVHTTPAIRIRATLITFVNIRITESCEVRMAWLRSNCLRKFVYIVATIVAFVCLTGSSVCFTIIFMVFCPSCEQHNSVVIRIVLTLSSLLLLTIGLITLWKIIFRKGATNSSAEEAVISSIPARDLEKSPAPILPYSHIPRNQPSGETSSIDLPDYFTTVWNEDLPDYITTIENVGFWTNSEPKTPPPDYEQAVAMETLVTTAIQ